MLTASFASSAARPGGTPLGRRQLLVVVLVSLGVFLPINNGGIVGLVVLGHDGCSAL
jgi:hypothetical protein